MADSPNSRGGLLNEFRRLIGDTTYRYIQCEISCDDSSATGALLEITDSHLITTITGGTADSLDLDLTQPQFDIIELLVNEVRSHPLYSARVASDGEGTHASGDLEIIAPKVILRNFVQLRSRRWSDSELEDLLETALIKLGRDTGSTYDLTTVPSRVKDLMFLLATVSMYWDQINNATKRRGLDLRVEDFRTLHQTLLDEYDRSLKAFKATEPPPISTLTEEQIDEMQSGEIIVGTQFRRNLRTQRMVPSVAVPFPASESLLATFIGGAKVRLDWSRSRTHAFHHYEVWRGTDNTVSNASEISRPLGALPQTGTKIATVYESERTLWVDGGTSPLPPGTYFYRLYIYNINGEWAASDIASATVI
jgi:hypothetical protein